MPSSSPCWPRSSIDCWLHTWVAGPLAVWTVVAGLTLAYGAVDEMHQSFVPGRHPSLADIGYDALGALAGLFLAELSVQIRRRARSCQ